MLSQQMLTPWWQMGQWLPRWHKHKLLQKPTLQRQRLKSDFSIQEEKYMGFFTIRMNGKQTELLNK